MMEIVLDVDNGVGLIVMITIRDVLIVNITINIVNIFLYF